MADTVGFLNAPFDRMFWGRGSWAFNGGCSGRVIKIYFAMRVASAKKTELARQSDLLLADGVGTYWGGRRRATPWDITSTAPTLVQLLCKVRVWKGFFITRLPNRASQRQQLSSFSCYQLVCWSSGWLLLSRTNQRVLNNIGRLDPTYSSCVQVCLEI